MMPISSPLVMGIICDLSLSLRTKLWRDCGNKTPPSAWVYFTLKRIYRLIRILIFGSFLSRSHHWEQKTLLFCVQQAQQCVIYPLDSKIAHWLNNHLKAGKYKLDWKSWQLIKIRILLLLENCMAWFLLRCKTVIWVCGGLSRVVTVWDNDYSRQGMSLNKPILLILHKDPHWFL